MYALIEQKNLNFEKKITMLTGLVHAHSGLRYIALALLLVAIVNALVSLKSGKYLKKDKMINLFAMIILHIQLLIGLVLYFTSEKVQFIEGIMADKSLRFFDIEHPIMMILAIILITLGRKKAENNPSIDMKHKLILRYYVLGLVLIFIAIPWPFMYPEFGLGYF
jgi:hypothetical protein